MIRYALFYLMALIHSFTLQSQDPHRFDGEIEKLANLKVSQGDSVSVFTGSSSIRFWVDLQEDCQNEELINTGFGGSHMSDLLYFIDELVLRFNPNKVFIYEGDNDIAGEKEPNSILMTTKAVVQKIWQSDSTIHIYFISPKPSPSRWHLQDQYEEFNGLLKSYCDSNQQLHYLDVWNAMLNDQGLPYPAIFVSDSLHMNRQGYAIWREIICPHSN